MFFVATLWVGTKVANRAYSLDPSKFTSSTAKPDGFFYKAIRLVGGGRSFGSLLSSIFKDYSRRLENLSWIIYAVGLVTLIRIFISDNSSEPIDQLVFLSEMAIPFLAAFVGGRRGSKGMPDGRKSSQDLHSSLAELHHGAPFSIERNPLIHRAEPGRPRRGQIGWPEDMQITVLSVREKERNYFLLICRLLRNYPVKAIFNTKLSFERSSFTRQNRNGYKNCC